MAHWRDSGRSVRFGPIDFRASFPLLFFFIHIRLWTFLIALVAILFFALIERYGFTVNVFIRWLRSFIAGPRKIAQPKWKY